MLASAAEAASLFRLSARLKSALRGGFLRTEFGCWEPQRLKSVHSGAILPRPKVRPVTTLASKQSIVFLRFARIPSSSQSCFRKIPKTMRLANPTLTSHRTQRWGEAPSARCVVNANTSGGRTASAALGPTEVGISRCLMPDSHSGCAGDSWPEPTEGARGQEGVDESVD